GMSQLLPPLRVCGYTLMQSALVDAGGFHRHGSDTGLTERVRDGMQVGGVGSEGADLPRSEADDLVVGVDVDTGGVGIVHLEGWCVVPKDELRMGLACWGFQLATRHGIGYLRRREEQKPRYEGEGPG